MKNKDNLIHYVQSCVRVNDKDTLIGQMALLAEQALIFNENFNDTIESIVED